MCVEGILLGSFCCPDLREYSPKDTQGMQNDTAFCCSSYGHGYIVSRGDMCQDQRLTKCPYKSSTSIRLWPLCSITT